MKNNLTKTVVAVVLSASGSAHAAGFALIEQSASGMGNAFSGAAGVEDASTIFFNPAGMTYIDGTQVVSALHLISPNFEFKNNGSISGTARPLGDEGPDAGDIAFVPNLYWVTDINPSMKFGVGVNAPFGLKTEYDDEWVGRFQAVKSEVKTININPSFAFKVNDQLSLGFGLSAMWAEAELTRQINAGVAEPDIKIKGDDWGFGFNLGAIYQATPDTRFGLAYRSKVKQEIEGESKFDGTGPTAALLNSDISARVDLPETLSFNVFSQLNSKWDVMADATWTRWSRFEELRIKFDSGAPDSVTEEKWKNTMRYSLGVNYHYNDAIKLRAGLAYDESPVNGDYRTARIPGNDRKWISFGAGYQMSPASKFDIGYSHLFISDVKIDDDQTSATPLGNGRLKGEYEGSVDILSVQYTHNF
jgi:long-chain fatty acid transport protein